MTDNETKTVTLDQLKGDDLFNDRPQICNKQIGVMSLCDLPKDHIGPHHDNLSGVSQ